VIPLLALFLQISAIQKQQVFDAANSSSFVLAVEGDVKALDLYLKRCDQWIARKRVYPAEPMREISDASPFIQRPRNNDGDPPGYR
jgi:hypothetical protein